jgi:hypothetical protein
MIMDSGSGEISVVRHTSLAEVAEVTTASIPAGRRLATPAGLLALFVFLFMIGMAGFFFAWFRKKSRLPPGGK